MARSARDVLNEHRWHTGDLERLDIVVVHRGASGDERIVRGADVADIGAKGLTLREGGEHAEETFLPYHRLLAIRGLGRVVWSRPVEGGTVVFRCARCSAQVTEPVDPMPEGWHPDQEELGAVGHGRYWRAPSGLVRVDPAVLLTTPGPWDDHARSGDGERAHHCPAGHRVAVEDGFPGLAWMEPGWTWSAHP